VAEAALEVVLAFFGDGAEAALGALVAAAVGVGLDFAGVVGEAAQAAAGGVFVLEGADLAAFEAAFGEEAALSVVVLDAAAVLDFGADAAAGVVLEGDFGVGGLGPEGAATEVVFEGAEGLVAVLDREEVAGGVAGEGELGAVGALAGDEAVGAIVVGSFDAGVEVLDEGEVAGEVVGEVGVLALGVLEGGEAGFGVPGEAVGAADGVCLFEAVAVGGVAGAPFAAAGV